MLETYTPKYTRIFSGYMGQLVEWPEVITEGETTEQCRELLEDALQEMIAAYREQKKEIPVSRELIEQALLDAYPFTTEQFAALTKHFQPPQEWYDQEEMPF